MSPTRLNGALTSAGVRTAAPIFGALGDVTRLRLVALLCASGPLSIAQLTAGTEVTRQAVTKHLQVLSSAGLVNDHWVGRERVWELDSRQLNEARRSLDLIAQEWDGALTKLKAAVEGSNT